MALRLTSRGLAFKKRIAIVSVAVGGYAPVADDLVKSFVPFRREVDVFCYKDLVEIGAPPHHENPYAFKVYAIDYVRSKGYDIVIWCDSCVRATRSMEEFARQIEQVGVYLQYDGHVVGRWCNDRTLEYFGLTRDKAMEMSTIYACMMGFDFRTPIARQFFTEWKQACQVGLFRGKWTNTDRTESADERCQGHRHDQSCAGLIAQKLGIPFSPLVVVAGKPQDTTRFFTTWNHP